MSNASSHMAPGRRVIMHVITNFTARAGAETMLARLLQSSVEDRVVVVPLMDVSERNRILSANSAVCYKPLHCRPFGANLLFDLGRASFRLRDIIREEKPHAVVCWMYHAMILGALGSRLAGNSHKLFWNVRQSLDDPKSLSYSSRLAVAAARRLSTQPSAIIYNSQRALELHRAYGYRNQNSIVIPNGFPLPPLATSQRPHARVLGIAGRYHPQKDHATFFRAAALAARGHPDLRFIAVGNGLTVDNETVTTAMNKAGLTPDKIELRGEVDEMSLFYSDIDGLVLSSRTEGFPNVVAEAMSYGKPVIATDVGDTAAIVAETGFVCAPQDPEALAAAMRNLVSLPSSEYASLCRSARKRIETHFGLADIAARYRAVLQDPTI
jgi:glycosyltransferase involved in cell wall biosynthesis